MKNKKERDWKFIIGMIVLLAIFAVMGGAFWNYGRKAGTDSQGGRAERGSKCYFCNLYRDRRISEDRSFVDLNNGTIFSADIPAEGIYNKKEN